MLKIHFALNIQQNVSRIQSSLFFELFQFELIRPFLSGKKEAKKEEDFTFVFAEAFAEPFLKKAVFSSKHKNAFLASFLSFFESTRGKTRRYEKRFKPREARERSPFEGRKFSPQKICLFTLWRQHAR
jgi:hypothetical protein